MIERLGRLVATHSISREEAAIADLVRDEFAATGLQVEREGNNLWCALGDAPRPRLLLNSHLDTVPPGAGWTGDPWHLRRVDDRLVGLGANDAKGCVVAMIQAVLELKRTLASGTPLGGTIVLALTAEEEINGAGLGSILPALGPLDAAVVGEPTGLVPMIAQRGLLILRGTARGRTAHPANTPPQSAQNAILAATAELARLADFDWGPEHPLLGRCHGNVTMIHGGVARNVIPDACDFFLDVRTTPAETHAALFERLRAFLKCDLAIHSERLTPVETAGDAPIARAASRASDKPPAGSPAMSDMVFLSGIPSVKIGPGVSSRSHTPDEYVLPEELHAGAAVYERIARAYFTIMKTRDPLAEPTLTSFGAERSRE